MKIVKTNFSNCFLFKFVVKNYLNITVKIKIERQKLRKKLIHN